MITVQDMDRFGGVIVRLFLATYPDGTTVEQLRHDAPRHGWIRMVLAQLEEST